MDSFDWEGVAASLGLRAKTGSCLPRANTSRKRGAHGCHETLNLTLEVYHSAAPAALPRGTGAPGFADKSAYDLAVERGLLELSAELKTKPQAIEDEMESDAERCAEYEKFKKIDAAFRAGDLDALRAALDRSFDGSDEL
jgi:hypothetical protein